MHYKINVVISVITKIVQVNTMVIKVMPLGYEGEYLGNFVGFIGIFT